MLLDFIKFKIFITCGVYGYQAAVSIVNQKVTTQRSKRSDRCCCCCWNQLTMIHNRYIFIFCFRFKKKNIWGESDSPRYYTPCLWQFMQISLFFGLILAPLLPFLFASLKQDEMSRNKWRKKRRENEPKKRELPVHGLLCSELFGTIRLASD